MRHPIAVAVLRKRLEGRWSLAAGLLGLMSACGETSLTTTTWMGEGTAPPVAETLWVDGRTLRGPCGEEILLRGVNEMIVYTDGKDGLPEFGEIAKTGANAVRIVWNVSATSAELDAAVGNALAAGLIPMVELHDAQGDLSKLPLLLDYWTRPAVLSVIAEHERFLIVAIGSGVGAQVTAEEWESSYLAAIDRLRSAGIRTPIVVDAPGWGQDIDRLQASGPRLIAADPLRSLLLSVSMWWTDSSRERIHAELLESVTAELPLIVGEFSSFAIENCPNTPFDYQALLAETRAMRVGYFAWSWGGVKNSDCPGQFDMTTDGTFAGLYGWGLEVAVTDPNGIRNTSIRPRSLTDGCRQP